MKRLLCLLCALMMVFTCGCSNVENCSHNYEVVKTVDASCTKNGYIKYECDKCDHTYKTELPKSGHDFKNGICTRCGTNGSPVQGDANKPVVGPDVGNLCPDFSLTSYFEEKSLTSDQLRGKVTVITFWYVYCSACVQELKTEFPKLNQNYGDDVQVVVVHSFEEFGLDIPSWIESNLPTDAGFLHCRDNENDVLFKSLGGKDSWPVTVILDENGIIQYTVCGSTTYEEMKPVLDLLLSQ